MARTQPHSVPDVVEEMLQSVKASPQRQRRLRSKTFWANFGFAVRTKERVATVRSTLAEKGLLVNLENLGEEDKDEWIVLSYVEPPKPEALTSAIQGTMPDVSHIPFPPDEWFDRIQAQEFESEREVEIWFVLPLLLQLGYQEPDLAVGFPVTMFEGVKKVQKEADCIVFNGRGREKEDALLVVECKRSSRIILDDAVGQARAYAMWLSTPYYLVTNGDQVKLFLFRGAIQTDVQLLHCDRNTLKDHWPVLYQHVARDSVVDYKRKLNHAIL